jgi:hypothetical protein
MKVRYIESKPIEQTLEFEDRESYGEFIRKKLN